MHPSRSGFTLLELSIVLVIIGLVVGGVLLGGDLIAVATLKKEVRDLERYQQAILTFRMRYNALPGDFARADSIISDVTAGHNGDGNGMISFQGGDDREYGYVWEHLSKANLVQGKYDGTRIWTDVPVLDVNAPRIGLESSGLPLAVLAGDMRIYGPTTQGKDVTQAFTFFTAVEAGIPFSSVEAANLDRKIDDGYPESGKVLGATADDMFDGMCTTGPGSSAGIADGELYNTSTDKECFVFVLWR